MKIKNCLIVFFFVLSNTLMACNCPDKIPFEEDYSKSASVIVGQVVNRQVKVYSYQENGIKYKWTYFEYEISVKQIFKGEYVKTIKIATTRKSPACIMKFRLGKDYLIYAHSDKRYGLYTNDCSRNFPTSDSRLKEELVALHRKSNIK